MIPDKVRQQDKRKNRGEKKNGNKGTVVGSRWKPREILWIVAEFREVMGINFQASEAMRTNEKLGEVLRM